MPLPTNQPQTKVPTAARKVLASILLAIPHAVATILMVLYCRYVIAEFKNYFNQHEVLLQAMTLYFLWLGDAIQRMPLAVIMITMLLDVLLIFGLISLPNRFRWISQVWTSGYLIAVILFLFYAGAAMGLPFWGNQN